MKMISLVIVLLCLLLVSCHAPSRRVVLHSEEEMHTVLRGEWIRQDYVDAIHAGRSPYDMSSHLNDMRLIVYQSDRDCKIKWGPGLGRIRTTYDDVYKLMPNYVKYIVASQQVVFMEEDKRTDTALLVIEGGDTLLRFQYDSLPYTMTKYHYDTCTGHDPYSFLLNENLFAGRYYSAGDSARRSPVVFTSCGSVSGLGVVESRWRLFQRYYVLYAASFDHGRDEVRLYKSGHSAADTDMVEVPWSLQRDTLHLADKVLIKTH